jgi:hypothetical protein
VFVFAWSVVLLSGVQAARVLLESWPVAEVGPAPTSWSVFVHAPLARPPLHLFELTSPAGLAAIALGVVALVLLARGTSGASWLLLAPASLFAFAFQTGLMLLLLVLWSLMRLDRGWRSIAAASLVWAGTAGLWPAHTFLATDLQVHR